MQPDSFSEQLLHLQEPLRHFAYLLTTNHEEAQDLLQETSFRALKYRDKYVSNTNFKGWIFTLMRNIFINNYRQAIRTHSRIEQTEDFSRLHTKQNSIFNPEESFTVTEIIEIIKSFPDEIRIPFSMLLSGFKYQEIAEKMGLPLGTIKSRIFFARKQLKELLKEYK